MKTKKWPNLNIEEVVESMNKDRLFTSLDLLTGYWIINLDRRRQEMTLFRCKLSSFCFFVMPFGVENGAACSQLVAAVLLQNLLFVIAYNGNILIRSQSGDDHIEEVGIVLGCLRQVGLKLQAKKSELGRAKISMLGHFVSAETVRMDQDKVGAFTDASSPNTKTELWSFLGMVYYYSRLIKGVAHVAAPLHQ